MWVCCETLFSRLISFQKVTCLHVVQLYFHNFRNAASSQHVRLLHFCIRDGCGTWFPRVASFSKGSFVAFGVVAKSGVHANYLS